MRHATRLNMHVGWVSGIPTALALLQYGRKIGNNDYSGFAVKTIDKICREGISPIGCFWPEWSYVKGWGTGWNPKPHWIHSRTISEATLFLVRALKYEKSKGRRHPLWEKSAKQNISFILKQQDKFGNFGTYYNLKTAKTIERQGTAGILWIAVLCEAAEYFKKPKWLK